MSVASPIALVTGASRGIGAQIAQIIAQRGVDVIIGYRSKAVRAETVASRCNGFGSRATLIQADLTVATDRKRLVDFVRAANKKLNLLVLNASGGLEKDKPDSYAMDMNCIAQDETVQLLQPLMSPGSTIVFVTSHWSHFHGKCEVLPMYRSVAKSKNAGEVAIRSRQNNLWDQGIRLIVVSGDIVENTVTPKLLDRAYPGFIVSRRKQVGTFPTVEDFALAIVDAAFNPSLATSSTVFVGSTDLRIPQHFLEE